VGARRQEDIREGESGWDHGGVRACELEFPVR
jgi:hypothetical protein